MRTLPDKPHLSRKKFSVSLPGEVEPEVAERLRKLKMTPQQYFESLVAFDLILEKAHILTGPHIRAGRLDAWHLWQEIVAEFGNPKKSVVAYTEMFLERLLSRSINTPKGESDAGGASS